MSGLVLFPMGGTKGSDRGASMVAQRGSVGGVGGGRRRPVSPEPRVPDGKQQRSKRLRRHHHHHGQKGNPLRKRRLRRGTQPAPNNNNEFLMQEHDHLYHLDAEAAQLHDPSPHSSPEDEEDFLARDFSNAYDVVHAERLSTMTKAELIQEYQLLEERVESLERKLRRPDEDSELRKLKEENKRLKAVNKTLRNGFPNVSISDHDTDNDDPPIPNEESSGEEGSYSTNSSDLQETSSCDGEGEEGNQVRRLVCSSSNGPNSSLIISFPRTAGSPAQGENNVSSTSE